MPRDHRKLKGVLQMTNQLNARESMTNTAITRLYEKKLITKEQEPSARTLYRSSLQSYQRTNDKTKPSYAKVEFMFDSPLDMAIQFITNLPNEWTKWQEFQTVYDSRLEEEDDSSRPSIDRIDSNGHYSIDNIQTETLKGNYTEASERRRKPVGIMIVEDGELSFELVDSLTDAKQKLDVSSDKLKKMKSQPYDLKVKNEDGELIATGKQIFALSSYQVSRKEYLQMEVEHLLKVQADYQEQNIDMGWVNEKVAELTEQINNPVALKSAIDKQDKESYERLKASIERQEALSADKIDSQLLIGMKNKLEIFEANGFHLLE